MSHLFRWFSIFSIRPLNRYMSSLQYFPCLALGWLVSDFGDPALHALMASSLWGPRSLNDAPTHVIQGAITIVMNLHSTMRSTSSVVYQGPLSSAHGSGLINPYEPVTFPGARQISAIYALRTPTGPGWTLAANL